MDRRDLGAQLGLIALWSFLLLLALRFGARTYPGVWHPEWRVLNWLLNGTTLFAEIGYDLVLVAAWAAMTRLLIDRTSRHTMATRRTLAFMQATTVALAIAIIFYGVWWAIQMQRLPWQDQ